MKMISSAKEPWRPPTDCCCTAPLVFTFLGGPPHSVSSHSEADSLSCLVTVANTTVLSSLWQQMQPPFPPMSPIDLRRVRACARESWMTLTPISLLHKHPMIHTHNELQLGLVYIKVKKKLSIFTNKKRINGYAIKGHFPLPLFYCN